MIVVDFQRDVFCLFGLPFDAVNMAEALERVRNAAAQGTRCVISTPNTNWVVSCLTDTPFRDSAIHSDLSIVDGMPLVWIARFLGLPIREPVPGSTLFDQLRRGDGRQLSVFFFGGGESVADAACRRLLAENQGLTCAGFDPAGFGSVEDMSSDRVIQQINASGADFLVVSLGARKGQAWIERNRARLSTPLISHLGAVVNFVAGTVTRAPRWMRRLGLEWLWRIKEEPTLWPRYFRDGLTLMQLVTTRVLPYAWYLRTHQPSAESLSAAGVDTREERDEYVITVRGAWSRQNLAPLRECFTKVLSAGKDVRFETGTTTYVDSSFVGLMVLLQGHQQLRGKAFKIVDASETVRRVVRYCCAEFLLSPPTVVLATRTRDEVRKATPPKATSQGGVSFSR
jgi:N-acetylglucosaminyldiphosphoundecaprenol N-acetyl-beta-D-mannosaminyltransferase